MTFEYNVNKNSIEYDGKHFAYCNAEQLKIARKLNELNDECEFLEIENKSLEDGATKYAKLYHQSLKENEELKRRISELEKENKELKSKFKSEEVDLDYVLCLLKRTIGELKYFIKDYEEDEIDITVHSLIRDVDLFLGDKQDIFSGYISYIIDCKEYLEKENEQLKKSLERKQRRIDAYEDYIKTLKEEGVLDD